MKQRSVIHDNNAYLRFKRLIRELIQEAQSPNYWHSVGKHPWKDDTIVIHGQIWHGSYYGLSPVSPEVGALLRAHGIEFEVSRCEQLQIGSISIRIDQEACPLPSRPGRRPRADIYTTT